MRVIAGKARSISLRTPKGMATRPTSDRIKETLFNLLQPFIYDSVFMDLFSGSGGIGIEALSRGAKYCVFVEKNKDALTCIKENLQKTNLKSNSQIIENDVMFALQKLDGQMLFDCIFIDPPYGHNWEKQILFYLKDAQILAPDGLIIIEAAKETDFSYTAEAGFALYKEKIYKTNKHVFLKKQEIKHENSRISREL